METEKPHHERRVSAKKYRTYFAHFLIIFAFGFGLVALGDFRNEAHAQSPGVSAVCLSKTDTTGGRMRFIVLDVDAVAFQAAGFTQIPCPTITPEIVDGQKARCDKLRQLPKEFSDIIEDRFAMNIDAMCGATNAWYGLASPVTP